MSEIIVLDTHICICIWFWLMTEYLQKIPDSWQTATKKENEIHRKLR